MSLQCEHQETDKEINIIQSPTMKIKPNKQNTILAIACLGSILLFATILFEIPIASSIALFVGSLMVIALMIIGFIALFKIGYDYKAWIISSAVVIAIFFIVIRYLIVSGWALKIGIFLIGLLVGVGFILSVVENSMFCKRSRK